MALGVHEAGRQIGSKLLRDAHALHARDPGETGVDGLFLAAHAQPEALALGSGSKMTHAEQPALEQNRHPIRHPLDLAQDVGRDKDRVLAGERPGPWAIRGGAQTLLLLTGSALTEQGLALAAQIAGKTGCKVMGQTYNPRMARGKGRFSIDRIPYVIEQALPILKDFKHIVLVEANDPVAFFAYPNKPSMLKPDGCEVHRMTSGGENSVAALEALAAALGARPIDAKPQALVELAKPTGALTHASIAQAIAMAIPENAIVVDESITTGRGFFPPTAAANPHDWLQNMGGSIGFSMPMGRSRKTRPKRLPSFSARSNWTSSGAATRLSIRPSSGTATLTPSPSRPPARDRSRRTAPPARSRPGDGGARR